jgi:hypothetical protein
MGGADVGLQDVQSVTTILDVCIKLLNWLDELICTVLDMLTV